MENQKKRKLTELVEFFFKNITDEKLKKKVENFFAIAILGVIALIILGLIKIIAPSMDNIKLFVAIIIVMILLYFAWTTTELPKWLNQLLGFIIILVALLYIFQEDIKVLKNWFIPSKINTIDTIDKKEIYTEIEKDTNGINEEKENNIKNVITNENPQAIEKFEVLLYIKKNLVTEYNIHKKHIMMDGNKQINILNINEATESEDSDIYTIQLTKGTHKIYVKDIPCMTITKNIYRNKQQLFLKCKK